jgi:hypothetical protein
MLLVGKELRKIIMVHGSRFGIWNAFEIPVPFIFCLMLPTPTTCKNIIGLVGIELKLVGIKYLLYQK